MLPRKILLVDDSKTILEVLKGTLKQLGVDDEFILTARTAREALKAFHEHKPALVFMDIQLPDKSGEKTALKMLDETPLTRVVVMTGLENTDKRVRNLVSAGAYEVVEKPIHIERIRKILELLDEDASGLHRVK